MSSAWICIFNSYGRSPQGQGFSIRLHSRAEFPSYWEIWFFFVGPITFERKRWKNGSFTNFFMDVSQREMDKKQSVWYKSKKKKKIPHYTLNWKKKNINFLVVTHHTPPYGWLFSYISVPWNVLCLMWFNPSQLYSSEPSSLIPVPRIENTSMHVREKAAVS